MPDFIVKYDYGTGATAFRIFAESRSRLDAALIEHCSVHDTEEARRDPMLRRFLRVERYTLDSLPGSELSGLLKS